MKTFKHLALTAASSVAAWTCCISPATADTVELKTGSKLEGEILDDRSTGDAVVINTGTKTLSLPRAQVSKVAKDDAARAEYKQRVAKLKATDAGEQFALFQWAQEHKLFESATTALHATLKADPQHAGARQLLGMPSDAMMEFTTQANQDNPEGLVVGVGPNSSKAREEQLAYEKRVLELARKLGRTDTSDAQKQEALSALQGEGTKAADVLLGALDCRRVKDAEVRLGAVQGLNALKPVSPRVSPTLAWSAVMDPSKDVRGTTTALIKERKDDAAVCGIIKHLMGAFNEGGEAINASARDNAVASLRAMGDSRIAPTLVRYCVMELRPTVTEGTLKERSIQSYTVLSGATATIIIPLSLPIEFPELTIRRVRTTASAPASALRAFAERDFDNDAAWDRWAKAGGK